MARYKPDQRQQEFDFPRGRQLALLDDARFETTRTAAGDPVSGKTLKAVLVAIDSFGRGRACWAKHETIARRANMSIRTEKRAVHCLETLGVLIRERKNRPGQRYSQMHLTIVWSQLAVLCSLSPPSPPDARSGAMTARDDQSANLTDQSANLTDQSASVALPTEALREAQRNRLPLRAPSHPPTSPTTGGSMTERALDNASWRQVEEVLCRLGMGDAAGVVELAIGRGLSPGQILADAAWFEQHRSRFRSIGALHWRIRNARPGQPPEDPRGWPQPSREYVAEANERARDARRAAQAAEDAHRQRQLDEERAQLDRLEGRHGGHLDALDAATLDELVRRLVEREPWLRQLARKPRASNLVRAHLLMLLEADAKQEAR